MFRSTKDFETFQNMTMAAGPIMEYLELDDALKLYQPGFRDAKVSLLGRRVQARFSYIGVAGWGVSGHNVYWLVIQADKQADGWLLSHRKEVCISNNKRESLRGMRGVSKPR